MAFTIPNVGAASFANQAEAHQLDVDILAAAAGETGVISGGAVTAQGTPDMTVAVAAGVICVDGVRATVAAGNSTITAAHATLDRYDLVSANSSGTKVVTAGTAAADPTKPTLPATSVALAEVYVPGADTAIGSTQIVDKRAILSLVKSGRGGLGIDASGSTGFPLFTAGSVAIGALVSGDIPTHNHAATDITSAALGLARGGTNADLSATGGAGQFLTQASAGAAITLAVPAGGSATVYQALRPEDAQFLAANFPQFVKTNGTNFPVAGLSYDADADENAYWQFDALNYSTGNITARILWYADSASSGDVVFTVAMAAITPNTDSQDVETDALATEHSVTDTHLGTTGQRVHEISATISNMDSVAAGDRCWLRVSRDANAAGDTMTGDAIIIGVRLSYTGA